MSYISRHFFGEGRLVILSASAITVNITINGVTTQKTLSGSRDDIAIPRKSEVIVEYDGKGFVFTFGYGDCKMLDLTPIPR